MTTYIIAICDTLSLKMPRTCQHEADNPGLQKQKTCTNYASGPHPNPVLEAIGFPHIANAGLHAPLGRRGLPLLTHTLSIMIPGVTPTIMAVCMEVHAMHTYIGCPR